MAITVTVIRHANARPAKPGEKDEDRSLSDVGFAQAERRRNFFKTFYDQKFDLGVVTRCMRTRQTLELVTDPTPRIGQYNELSDQTPGAGDLIGEAHARLRGQPLGPYLDEKQMRKILIDYGERGWKVILAALERTGAQNPIITNHDVLAPAIVMSPLGWGKSHFSRFVLDFVWPECGGLKFVLVSGIVTQVTPLTAV